jgi:hypothetical protein
MTLRLTLLLLAHLLADYPLQGDFLANMKGKRILLMISHCGIWTGCIVVAAAYLGIPPTTGLLAFLFVGHFLADEAKAQRWWFYENLDPLGAALWVDQSFHVLQILCVLFFWSAK